MSKLRAGRLAGWLVIIIWSLLLAGCGEATSIGLVTSPPATATVPAPATTQAAPTQPAPTLSPPTPTPVLSAHRSVDTPVPATTEVVTTEAATPTELPTPSPVVIDLTTTRPATPTAAPAVTPPVAVTPGQLDQLATGILLYTDSGDIKTLTLPAGPPISLTRDGAGKEASKFPQGFNHSPVWSPAGKQIAFASARETYQQPAYQQGFDVFVMNADGSNPKKLGVFRDSGSVTREPLAWLPTGQILVRQESHQNDPTKGVQPPAILLDVATGQVLDLGLKGGPFQTYSHFSPSADGKLLAFVSTKQTGTGSPLSSLALLDLSKPPLRPQLLAPLDTPATISDVALSPDKTRLAYVLSQPSGKPGQLSSNLYLTNLNNPNAPARALTNFEATLYVSLTDLTWSADGRRLVFSRSLGDGCGGHTLYSVNPDGSGLREFAPDGRGGVPPYLSFGPGGRWLAYSVLTDCGETTHLLVLDLEKGTVADLGSGYGPLYSPAG